MLFTWSPSPLQSSKVSFEYLLLPPRSALEAASPGISRRSATPPPRPPTHADVRTPSRSGIGPALKRHPFSGLVDSAGELLHIP
jgi:hypothetical protein